MASLSGFGTPYDWIYGALGAIAVCGALLWRWRNHTIGPRVPDLSPTELALLNGGHDLALAASLADLHAAGAIRIEAGAPRTTGAPHLTGSMLDHAVLEAVRDGTAPGDGPAGRLLDDAHDVLTDAGILLDAPRRRLVREGSIPTFTVVGLGLALAAVGGYHGDWDGVWDVLRTAGLIAAAGTAMAVWVDPMPARTRAFIRQARRDAAFLDPATRSLDPATRDPALLDPGADPGYEPGVAGLAVALFGEDALRLVQPDLPAVCRLWTMGGRTRERRDTNEEEGYGIDGGPTGMKGSLDLPGWMHRADPDGPGPDLPF